MALRSFAFVMSFIAKKSAFFAKFGRSGFFVIY